MWRCHDDGGRVMGSCQARPHSHRCSPSLLRCCYPALCAPPARVICRTVGWELKIFVVIPKIIGECGSPNVCGYSQVCQQHRQLAGSPQQLYSPLHVAAVHFYLNIVWLQRAHFLAADPGPGAGEDTECGSGGDMFPCRGDHWHWHWHQPHTWQQRRNNTPAPGVDTGHQPTARKSVSN